MPQSKQSFVVDKNLSLFNPEIRIFFENFIFLMYIRLVLPTIWKNSSKFLYQKIDTENNK
jgi:hypothetical protein